MALVTGAARGIGLAVAERFVREGARVWLTDLLETLGREAAGRLGDAATFRRLDVREETHWRQVTDDLISEEGRLDVLVNNACITGFEDGATRPQDPEHASLEDWRAVFFAPDLKCPRKSSEKRVHENFSKLLKQS